MSDIEKIFEHLEACKPYRGARQQGVRRVVEVISDASFWIGNFSFFALLIIGLIHKFVHPLNKDELQWVTPIFLFGAISMFLSTFSSVAMIALLLVARIGKKPRGFRSRVRGHDQTNAFPLTKYPLSVLKYTKDLWKIHEDRSERPSGFVVGTNVTILAQIVALVGLVNGLITVSKENFPLLVKFGPAIVYVIAGFFALNALRALIGRFFAIRRSYRGEILDIAIKLKELQEDAPSYREEGWLIK
jgi:hypothetical protein